MAYARKIQKKRVPVEAVGGGLEEFVVLVGFLGPTAERGDGPLNNPTLAYIHEHGSPAANIPARPFLGPGVERAVPQLSSLLTAGARRALAGDPGAANQALQRVGVVAVGEVQSYMSSGDFAPLQPETIRRKGSSRPLIDTGQLRQAVTYSVRPRKATRQEPVVVATGAGARPRGAAGAVSGPRSTTKSRAEHTLRRMGIDPSSSVREDTDLGF
jgi:hypothetical protein